MKTIKVKFENPTGNRFSVGFSGKKLVIPAYAYGENALITDLPDSPAVGSWLDKLVARHRAIKVSPVDYEGDDTPLDTEEGSGTDNGSEGEGSGSLPPDGFKEFGADVLSVTESGGGWWTVEVKDIEPIKVRSCENEEAAILEAFNKHMEG